MIRIFKNIYNKKIKQQEKKKDKFKKYLQQICIIWVIFLVNMQGKPKWYQ